ncbi:MAG: hypothetical protein ACLTBD_07375 [Clostridia bacterium]
MQKRTSEEGTKIPEEIHLILPVNGCAISRFRTTNRRTSLIAGKIPKPEEASD